MDFNQAAMLAAGGSVVAFWNQLKGAAAKVLSFVIRNDKIESAFLIEKVVEEIFKDAKVIRWGSKTYLDEDRYIQKYDGHFRVIFSYIPSLLVLCKKKFPIILSESETGLRITYIPGTINLRAILEKAHKTSLSNRMERKQEKDDNFWVNEIAGEDKGNAENYTSAAPSGNQVGDNPSQSKLFKMLQTLNEANEFFGFLPQEIFSVSAKKEASTQYYWSSEAIQLDREVSFWMDSRSWYQERKIPWRRGAMLYGKCGTGKSKMVESVAKKHGLHVRKLNISNMSNSEFLKAYNTGPYDHSILLIEDIDSVLHGRTNILAAATHQKQLVSFDTIINCIGGIKSGDGVFLIITSNHPERLDEALIRNGRIDAKIEVGPLDIGGRKFIAENILRGFDFLVDKAVNECDGMVASEFENHCIELAITEKNKEYEN